MTAELVPDAQWSLIRRASPSFNAEAARWSIAYSEVAFHGGGCRNDWVAVLAWLVGDVYAIGTMTEFGI
jgi:hypothetical protein